MNLLKRAVERVANVHVYRTLPRGVDVANDIANVLTVSRIETVFDVGANVGQSAIHYLECFPRSHIYCFEPVSATFLQLHHNVGATDRIQCVQLALGSLPGKGEMELTGSSEMFSLKSSPSVPPSERSTTEVVDIATLDDFCDANSIRQINYLKIDTEGGDLDVLKGAEDMLNKQNIDFVEVEAGMNPDNKRHVPFEVLKQHLESKAYFLFGIYEQVHEVSSQLQLRRANAVFLSSRVVQEHQRGEEPV